MIRRWLAERQERAADAREQAEALIGQHGTKGAARLLDERPSDFDPATLKALRRRLEVLRTAKGSDRWPGP